MRPPGASVTSAAIRLELSRVLASESFRISDRLSALLSYLVEYALNQNTNPVKEYAIALDVFDRGQEFDPKTDPIVRVHIGRLRSKLEDYYAGDGKRDPIRIELPKRSYVPVFVEQAQTAPVVQEIPSERRAPRKSRVAIVIAASLAIAVAGVGLWLALSRTTDPSRATFRQITSFDGYATSVTVARGGAMVAYASDRGLRQRGVWIQPLSGESRCLTPDDNIPYESPDFSPDGTHLAFISGVRDVYVAPVTGGEPRRVAENGYYPRFSPDGKWIAFLRGTLGGEAHVYVLPAWGGPEREVGTAGLRIPLEKTTEAVWSPDGSALLIPDTAGRDGSRDWTLVPVDGGPPMRTGLAAFLQSRSVSPRVLDDWIGDFLYFTAATAESQVQGWRMRVDRRGRPMEAPEQLTTSPNMQLWARAAPGPGSAVVFVYGIDAERSDLWSLPLEPDGRAAKGARLAQLTTHGSIDRRMAVAKSGGLLAFASLRSGNFDIWTRNLGTGAETILVGTPANERPEFTSLNGKRLVYSQANGKQTEYFSMDLPGGQPRRICESCDLVALDSAGARTLETLEVRAPKKYYLHDLATGKTAAWFAEGRLAFNRDTFVFSPDDRWLAVESLYQDERKAARTFVVRMPESGSVTERDFVPIDLRSEVHRPQWSADGRLLYYFAQNDRLWTMRAVPFDPSTGRTAGEPFLVHEFVEMLGKHARVLPRFQVARDQAVIYLDDSASTLWAESIR